MSANAAASCSLSRSGNWIFNTAAEPSPTFDRHRQGGVARTRTARRASATSRARTPRRCRGVPPATAVPRGISRTRRGPRACLCSSDARGSGRRGRRGTLLAGRWCRPDRACRSRRGRSGLAADHDSRARSRSRSSSSRIPEDEVREHADVPGGRASPRASASPAVIRDRGRAGDDHVRRCAGPCRSDGSTCASGPGRRPRGGREHRRVDPSAAVPRTAPDRPVVHRARRQRSLGRAGRRLLEASARRSRAAGGDARRARRLGGAHRAAARPADLPSRPVGRQRPAHGRRSRCA